MENKQKAIEKAYAEHWEVVKDYVDENGFCSAYWNLFESLNGISKPKSQGTKWRPKSLQGIETNNDWQEIYSDGRIPNQDVWLIDKKGLIIFSPIDEFIPKEHNYTHYQPIIKPKPPIY